MPETAQARKEVIEARLVEIRGGDVGALVRESWEAHHGIMCIGINWERHSTPLHASHVLETSTALMPGHTLTHNVMACQHLSKVRMSR